MAAANVIGDVLECKAFLCPLTRSRVRDCNGHTIAADSRLIQEPAMPQHDSSNQSRRGPKQTRKLGPVHPNAAGVDVHSEFHFVAVPDDRDEQPVRRFGAFTEDLEKLADWLSACGITSVAMESTGVYWIPLFELLEKRGFHVVLI